jgi:hypothetical protein
MSAQIQFPKIQLLGKNLLGDLPEFVLLASDDKRRKTKELLVFDDFFGSGQLNSELWSL